MKHSLYSLFLTFICIISVFTTAQSIPEKKIILIIPSYNHPLEFTRECLLSALQQDYSNYEIIFSDDCSPQENIEQLHKQLIADIDTHQRITYRRNKRRLGPLGNRWNTFQSINPDNVLDNRDIIVANFDGDDILLRKDALKVINQLHEKAWTTWGSYSILPSRSPYCACQPVPESVITQNSWRQCTVSLSHMQAYRLSLLKDLPLYTYLWKGNFYPAAPDLQAIWGCCEKSGYHTAFNAIAIYGYRLHPNNEMNRPEGKLGADCLAHTRAQKPFQPLKELPVQRSLDTYHCDLIIFSNDNPDELSVQLQSLEANLPDINNVSILYKSTQPSVYNSLKYLYPHYKFLQISDPTNLKPLLHSCLTESPSEYVLFLTNNKTTHYVPLKDCMRALLKTHTHVFFTKLALLPTTNSIDIDNGMVAFDFTTINDPTIQQNHSMMKFFDLTIFSKKVLNAALESMEIISLESLEKQWNIYSQTLLHNIGLSFDIKQ